MNFLNLKYFIAIAEEKNISAAARNLYVSQQSLSEHLKKIEAEIGVPLFQRGSPLALTVAGECFLEGSKKILSEYDRMIANINAVTVHRRSRIAIGVPTYGEPPYLAELLTRFRSNHPQYEVSVVKRFHSDIAYNMLGVDLYISWLPIEPSLETVIVQDNVNYCVLLHKNVMSAAFGENYNEIGKKLHVSGNLSLLKEVPFIVLVDRHQQLSNDLELIFNEYAFTPKVGFQSENMDLNANMCRYGAGAVLVSADYIQHYFCTADGNLSEDMLCYPIHQNSFRSCVAICYEKDKNLHDAEICFINEMKEYFAEHPLKF